MWVVISHCRNDYIRIDRCEASLLKRAERNEYKQEAAVFSSYLCLSTCQVPLPHILMTFRAAPQLSGTFQQQKKKKNQSHVSNYDSLRGRRRLLNLRLQSHISFEACPLSQHKLRPNLPLGSCYGEKLGTVSFLPLVSSTTDFWLC